MERIRLILQLNGSFFQKHWECQTFSDFIHNRNTLDEIFFYLSCREILNEGMALDDQKNCFEIVQRMEMIKCFRLIRKILCKFSDRDSEMIIDKLRDAATTKKIKTTRIVNKTEVVDYVEKLYLDQGFVLRILLEMYRADKKARYVFLQKSLEIDQQLYDAIPSRNENFNKLEHEYLTGYENLRKYLDKHFHFLSETEKLQIYCDSYNIGGGEIKFETLFTILQEHGIFIKDQKVRQLITEADPSPLDKVFYKKLKDNQNLEYQIRDCLTGRMQNFGVESLSYELKQLDGYIDSSRLKFGWRDSALFLTKACGIRALVAAMSLAYMPELPQASTIETFIEEVSLATLKLVQPSKDYKLLAKVISSEQQQAATRITRQCKRKLYNDNWYRLMQNLLQFTRMNNPMNVSRRQSIKRNPGSVVFNTE
jgi:hypothetical protein